MSRPIPRRTFLRAGGVALALPFLDAMSPRGRAAEAEALPRRRLVSVCTTLGLHAPHLVPERAGRDFALPPYLKVLEAFRNDLTVFSGLSHPDVDGGHSSESSFLTAAPHPGATGFRNAISLDQFAAEEMAPDTRFPTLTLNSGSNGGSSLSWTRSGVMIPADGTPSKVFSRLFLDGSKAEVNARVRRLRDGQSIMDAVAPRAKGLEKNLGPADRDRLDQYFTSVRELERRLVRAEAWAQRPKPKVAAKPPTDIVDRADVAGRARLMFDLVHLAVQTDSSRLITLQIQGTGLVPPLEGVTIDHHNLSHHGKDPEKIAQLRIVEEAQFQGLRALLEQLKAAKEEGETLLDRTMVLFGSNLGNASSHDTKNMPMLLAGGGFKHGQHLAFDANDNAPLGRLFVSCLQRLGMETDQFAGSKGTLPGLEADRG